MADTKITGLLSPQVTTNPATDVLPIVNIADTLMASSGSTRKITVNQLLGAGGTATLASATISGDLTVRTTGLVVNANGVRVGINTTTINGGPFNVKISSAIDAKFVVQDGFTTGNVRLAAVDNAYSTYKIMDYSALSHAWYNSGSTAMTLNSTGLGVGVVPSTYKLEVGNGSVDARALFKSNNAFSIGVQNGASGIGGWIGSTGNNILTFSGNDGTMKVTISDSGNVGIGVAPSYKFHALVASGYSGAFKASTAAITGVLIGNTVADLTVGVDASGNGRVTADTSKYLGLGSGGLNDRVILDSTGQVGIGVTPSAWRNTQRALQIGAVGAYFSSAASTGSTCIGRNVYESAAGDFTYIVNDEATFYEQTATGQHAWYSAAAGTGTITFGSAKMTLTASGDLLVGTTSLAGSSSNATAVILGSARTANGSVSTTTAVASTIFSITAALRGRYEVVALIANSGSPASYTSVASVIWDGNGGRVVANNGTNLTITLSGSDVQVTQTSGSAQTVFWSFLRVALA